MSTSDRAVVFDRRRFLLGTGGGIAGLVVLGQLPGELARAAPPRFDMDPFSLGIASGDPLPNGVVLWTRLAPSPFDRDGGMPRNDVAVSWEVASDDRMRRIVRSGTALAPAALAHSVHVEVSGLEPAREYYYRFRAGNAQSPVGRTKTAPLASASPAAMAFAFASCQHWSSGYYSAYRRMAEEDLDLVVHLGDYIYEGGVGPRGGARNELTPDVRTPNAEIFVPGGLRNETTQLDRYRLQYALYKSDPDLQLAHARFPWAVTWDDHEVDNDYAGDEPEWPQGGFLNRRADAYQAYYEHQPLRAASMPQGPDMLLYRRLRYGTRAEFSVLDGRQYPSAPPCGGNTSFGAGEAPRCPEAFDTTMLGPVQERWLLDGLGRSPARWNFVANQTLVAQLDHVAGPEQIFWTDAWDGYPGARQRILRDVAARGVRNPVVITGDWHSTFVNDLKVDFDDPASPVVATEFAGPAITSGGEVFGNGGYQGYYGPKAALPENGHIKFFNGDRRGYVRCRVGLDRLETDFRMVDSVRTADAGVSTYASFVVEEGRAGAHCAGGFCTVGKIGPNLGQ